MSESELRQQLSGVCFVESFFACHFSDVLFVKTVLPEIFGLSVCLEELFIYEEWVFAVKRVRPINIYRFLILKISFRCKF